MSSNAVNPASSKVKLFLALCIGLFWTCAGASAQTVTAGVTGIVTDSKGAVLPGAQVIPTNTATGVSFPSKTNGAGVYTINFLPIGPYTLEISARGFQKTSFNEFTLIGGQVAKFDATMNVGSENSVVTVTSEEPLLNTQNAELSTTMSHKMITELPLVANNVLGLALFTPGVVIAQPAQLDNVGGYQLYSFNAGGNREQSNNFTLDGQDIENPSANSLGYNVNRDALQEFRIITGNANAEYGNANGGQLVMVTTSGTNQFHGSASVQFQNTLMNANSWFDKNQGNGTPIARGSQNRDFYSATLGGPIKKDRLFFFVDYRGVRQHISSGTTVNQPDTAYGGNPQFDMTGHGGTAPAYDPSLNNGTGGFVTITNPAALYLLSHPKAYPVCNKNPCGMNTGTGNGGNLSGNYAGYNGTKNTIDQGDVKIDFKLDEKNLISGRWSLARVYNTTYEAITPTTFPGFGSNPYLGFVVNWDHTFSSNLVNEVRIGYSRSGSVTTATDIYGNFGKNGFQDLGVPSPTGQQLTDGFPQITFGGTSPGVSTIGSTSNNNRAIFNSFNFNDALSWQLGRHELRIGVNILRYQDNEYYAGNNGALGSFAFTGVLPVAATPSNPNPLNPSSGSAWADFLEDKASSYKAGAQQGEWGMRQWRPAIYFQDNYKILPNLTLNLGMRWEYDSPYTEVHNKQANVDPVTGAITVAGQSGAGAQLYKPFYGGFMPRVGFAYSPPNLHNRLVIRGGYGINNVFEGMGAGVRLTQNPMFLFNSTPPPNSVAPYRMTDGFGPFTPGSIAASSSFYAWDKNIKPALSQQFDMLVGYQISNYTSFQVGYAGQVGHHLANIRGLNQATCSTIPLPGVTTPCKVPFLSLYPKLSPGNFNYVESEGVMNYNALQATINQHAWHDLEVIGNYSYGKAMTDSAGFIGSNGTTIPGSTYLWPQDSYNLSAEYAPVYYDATHIVSAAFVYQLPIGRGKLIGTNWNHWVNTAIGGWKTGVTVQYRTGFPMTITANGNYLPSGHNSNSNNRANKYRDLKIVNRGVRSPLNSKAILWFGNDPSAEGAAQLKTVSTICPATGKTYNLAVGTTGSTGIDGRTGSSNTIVTNPTTNGCQTNPQHISLNPVSSNTVYTEGYTPNVGPSSTTQTIYTVNDNGISAYGDALSTAFGTSRPSTERIPGYHDISASVSKQFAIREGSTLDFRADAYNLFNSTSLAAPSPNIASTNFGYITNSISIERHLQLSVKLNF